MDEIASLAHHDGDIRPGDSTDELVFNPYNPVNKELDMHAVGEILRKYGVTLKPMNAELYKRAFVHKSYVKRPNLRILRTVSPSWGVLTTVCHSGLVPTNDSSS